MQQAINAIYNKQRYDLDIGIHKCFNGQTKHKRISSIKTLYHINCATLQGNQNDGIPILLIPSHINRGYIMDLMPEYSFVKKLESCGMSPYLLEWNDPSDKILHYSEAEYIENILIPIINYISAQHNRKILILGHCLGGVMALAATQLLQDKISGLITVATPWDFHHPCFIYKANHNIYNFILNNSNGGYVPKELIHIMMNWPHVNTSINKLISVSNLEKIDDLFLAVENWLDDNVNMTIPLLKTCVVKYSIQNQTYKSEWSISGKIIHPNNISIPMLNVVPIKDKVVPQGSSAPLSISSKNSHTLNLDTGHIGMLISRNDSFSLSILDWLKNYTKTHYKEASFSIK